MTWYEEKSDLKRAWRSLRTSKNSSQKAVFGGTVYEVYMSCVFRCADNDFVAEVTKMNVGKSKILWSGKNGYHRFQEIVVKFWVAQHPSFLDSYGV